MLVRIVGSTMPGLVFESHTRVHVGVQRGDEVVGLVPGDAPEAVFEFPLDGIRGPYVHGKRGDRFFYLSWGDVAPDGTFTRFRRAKLKLGELEHLDAAAVQALHGSLSMTDGKGGPVCATVHPQWTVRES